MTITLFRYCFFNDRTLGKLTIEGEKAFDTLEPSYRGQDIENSKIAGKTAIPCGVYPVVYNYSTKFKKTLPLLCNVPFFSGIRIHSGNYPKDTEGCILIGELEGDHLINSRVSYSRFIDILKKKALDDEEEIYINVCR